MFEKQTIKTYLTGREILTPDDLPIQSSERTGTDVFCTIFTSIFALALFVTACIQLNVSNLVNMTYPTDSMGRKCTLDNPNYNLLYFTNIKDYTKRVCVSECPQGDEQALKCWPTDEIGCSANNDPGFEVNIYPSFAKQTKLGLFCLPNDQKLQNLIIESSGMSDRFKFIEYEKSLFISLGIAVGLGCLYLILVKIIPKPMVFISIALGTISCFFAGIFMIIYLSKFQTIVIAGIAISSVILIILGIFLAYSLIFRRNQISLCGDYLANSIQVLSVEPGIWALIPLFLLMVVGLFALGGFQLFASWSSTELQFNKQNVYYSPTGTFKDIIKVLIILEMLWGFFFLKEAFSFIISGCGVTLHFRGDSSLRFGFINLFKYHWGSVVGGSFLTNFFFFPDIVYDFIKPNHPNSCFSSVCCCCDRILGFVRSQSMGFINMVGLPFCNSSRWCQKINYLSDQFDGNQSINRYFRMGSHAFLALIATILGFIQEIISGGIHPVGLIISFIINFFLVTYFVCLPADLAETELICKFTEEYISGDKQMRQTPYMGANRKNMIRQSDVDDGYQVLPTNHS